MLRRTLRGLLRSPAFTVSVILTLGLAITANLTGMSILSATILHKPPVNDPDKLVVAIEQRKNVGLTLESVRPSRYLAWRLSSVFDASAALRIDVATIQYEGRSKRTSIARVTPGFFRVLGTSPVIGTTFGGGTAESPSIVLSHRLWMQEFGGDRGIIGKAISSEGRAYTVVGVMPGDSRIPFFDPEAWLPLQDEEWKDAKPDALRLQVLARLNPGMNMSQAEQALTAISLSLPAEAGQQETEVRPQLMSLQDYIINTADVKPVMSVLMAAVMLVLLIACVNVSHLLFVRMSAKTNELGLQLSLGASRGRLLTGVLYESVLIAAGSVALGLFASSYSIRMLQSKLTFNDYVAAIQLRIDAPTLLFGAGIVLLLVVLMSAIPGMFLRSIRIDPILRDGGRGVTSSRRKVRMQAALVTVQAVSASILLILASAMIVRFVVAKQVSVGFDSSSVIVARLTLDQFEEAHRSQFVHGLLEGLRNRAGVESVAAASSLPMLGGAWMQMESGDRTQWRPVRAKVVSPDFFATLKIPILRGADFQERRAGSDRIIIVNDAFATQFLGAHPLDQTVRLRTGDHGPGLPYRVVGVVSNTKHWFGEPGDVPDIYRMYSEAPSVDIMIALRSSLGTASLSQIMRNVVGALEPLQPIDNITTYRSALELQESDEIVLLVILVFIAMLAVVLASLGIYGVLSYSIQMRRREFGLRLALGSTSFGLTCHVLKTSALLMGIGVAYGLLLTPVLVHLLDSVFRGKVTHIGTIISIVVIVEVFSILSATWVPARQASRVDPIELLRST